MRSLSVKFRTTLTIFFVVGIVLTGLPIENHEVQAGSICNVTGLNGSGTEADPYEISTACELAYMRDVVNLNIINSSSYKIDPQDPFPAFKSYYELTADIDLNGYDWEPIGPDGEIPFAGSFNGNGYTISNLEIVEENPASNTYWGLFGYLDHARIADLEIEISSIDVGLEDEHGQVGGLAGISDSSVLSAISIVSSDSEAALISGFISGGLVGSANNALIIHCSNQVRVLGNVVGGFVGFSGSDIEIINSYNTSQVVVLESWGNGGGFIGNSYADPDSPMIVIKNSYNWGQVQAGETTSSANLGGVIGSMWDGSNINLSNVYVSGNVESNSIDSNIQYSGMFIGAITKSIGRTIESSYYYQSNSLLSIGAEYEYVNKKDVFTPYQNPNDIQYQVSSSNALLEDLNEWITSENLSYTSSITEDEIFYLTWAILTPDGDPEFYIPEEDEESTALSTPRVPQKRDPHTLLTGQVGGIQTTDLAYLVAIPEQWMDSTAKVEFWLDAAAVTANQEGYAYLNAAAATLKTAGAKLLESYDVRLMKRVTGQDGTVSEGEVALEYVRGNLTSRLPIPAQLQTTAHLGLCWIDETGAIAFLESKRVTIDGVSYIEFANNNYTTAYAFIADSNHAAVVG